MAYFYAYNQIWISEASKDSDASKPPANGRVDRCLRISLLFIIVVKVGVMIE